jgi:hypothetical protein
MFIFELTARGQPLGETTIDGTLAFLDAGRDALVRAFTSATTPAMHEVWERTR